MGFENPIADALERIRVKAAAIEQDEAPHARPRGIELVTDQDMEMLAHLTYDQVADRLVDNAKPWADDCNRHWKTAVALKAAGQGRVFYSTWIKQFFAYLSAFPPVPGLVVLDATADLSPALFHRSIASLNPASAS